MPTFVPVVDQEKSRFERDDYDQSNSKHRKFDNPFALSKPKVDPTNKRGFETGSVGWGVLGEFGSNQKDDGSMACLTNTGKSKMVKNEKGLWVKAKDDDETEEGGKTKGKGRGNGISVFQNNNRNNNVQLGKKYESSSDRARPSGNSSTAHSRYRSRSRSPSPPTKYDSHNKHRHYSSHKDKHYHSRYVHFYSFFL